MGIFPFFCWFCVWDGLQTLIKISQRDIWCVVGPFTQKTTLSQLAVWLLTNSVLSLEKIKGAFWEPDSWYRNRYNSTIRGCLTTEALQYQYCIITLLPPIDKNASVGQFTIIESCPYLALKTNITIKICSSGMTILYTRVLYYNHLIFTVWQ